VETALWHRIKEARQPCLWIVDDLPSGLVQSEMEKRWTAQWHGASSLLTTRSTEYGGLGQHLDLGVLSEPEAVQLLTVGRAPQGAVEEKAAEEITRELGYHPLAVEVAGSYLAKGIQSFFQYRNELRSPDRDAMKFGARLRESLPTGHERTIRGTLQKSIGQLGQEGRDFLQLASVLAVAPIPVRFVKAVFEDATPRESSDLRLLAALDQADSLGLCTSAGDDARLVHTLVSRTMRYHAGLDDRAHVWRTAAVRALVGVLPMVTDIRRHTEVAREMVHARHSRPAC
jgi:hypothetical protein